MVKTEKAKISGLRYIEAVGRRKTAVARVRLFLSEEPALIVNGKDYQQYFLTIDQKNKAEEALKKTQFFGKIRIEAKIKGGGKNSQAEALRHGIARVLEKFQPDLRKTLKKLGFLKRDPRAKERRKFGLKKARKAPQWSKR